MNSTLKNFLGLNKLYSRKFGLVFLFDPLIMLAVVYIAFFSVPGSENGAILTTVGVLFYSLIVIYFLAEFIKALYIRQILKTRHYKPPIQHKFVSKVLSSGVNKELDYIDRTELVDLGENWGLFDVRFDFHRKTKHGNYLANQHFYTIYEVKLKRLLPHLIFDSKKAKGSQFKILYLRAQKLSFEGNFDDNFESYGPKTYHVDTLSFITPEVLQAMLRLNDCDIEIIDDSLLVFSPLLTYDEIPELKSRADELVRVLSDNIDTYRDNRLSGNKRKTDVTVFSKKLLENPDRYIVLTAIGSILSIGVVAAALYYRNFDILLNQAFLFLISFTVGGIAQIAVITRRNNKLERAFIHEQILHRTIADQAKHGQ